MGLFRRKKEPIYEVQSHDVPLSTMVRWFLHDIGYGEDRIDDLIGLSPISPEGVSKEIEDSEKRLSSLRPISPFIETAAEISANVLSTIAVTTAESNEDFLIDDEDTLELLNSLYYSIALSSIIGAFSIASALGLIEITAFASENRDMEGSFYE